MFVINNILSLIFYYF